VHFGLAGGKPQTQSHGPAVVPIYCRRVLEAPHLEIKRRIDLANITRSTRRSETGQRRSKRVSLDQRTDAEVEELAK